jgi:Pilus formation protein N terminal region
MIALPLIPIVSQWFDLMVRGGYTHSAGAIAMFKQWARDGLGGVIARSIPAAMIFTICLSAAPNCFAGEPASLTVERPPKKTMELTQGFSTTIHSERPFGKISITDPEIVDLVLRTDKSAVLIPQRTGRTNIDFLDDHGTLIGSMDVTVVRQGVRDRVVIYNRPSLGAYSTFHCGQKNCEHFEEIPNKEEALTPNLPQDRSPRGMPPQ